MTSEAHGKLPMPGPHRVGKEDHMKRKSAKKVSHEQVPAEPKGLVKHESRAVLAIRIPLQARDRLRAAAGWGRQQGFVYAAIMTVIEKVEKKVTSLISEPRPSDPRGALVFGHPFHDPPGSRPI